MGTSAANPYRKASPTKRGFPSIAGALERAGARAGAKAGQSPRRGAGAALLVNVGKSQVPLLDSRGRGPSHAGFDPHSLQVGFVCAVLSLVLSRTCL
jgi:hypothetical protein